MASVKDVLDWMDEVGGTALKEADTGLLNRLGANLATKHYLDNVIALKSMSREAWAAYYPQLYKEAERLYGEYQQDQKIVESVGKMDAVEERLGKLETMLAAFIESQKPAPEPDKPKRGKPKVEPVVPEDETDEDEPEGEEAETEA